MVVSHRWSLPRRVADDSTREVALSEDLRSKTGPWPPRRRRPVDETPLAQSG
jgi:hypothetical protein